MAGKAPQGRQEATVDEPETGQRFSPRVVDSLVDAVVLVDNRGIVLYGNPAVHRLLGREVGSLFGEPFTELVPEDQREATEGVLRAYLDADPLPPSQAPVRTRAMCSDGSDIPVEIALSVVDPEDGPRMVIAVIWDVTDRIDMERYQRVSSDLLEFLAGASGRGEEVVPQLLGILGSTLGFEFTAFWRWDPQSELIRCEQIWRADTRSLESVFTASMGRTLRPGERFPGLVVQTSEPVWHSELASETNLQRYHAFVADGVETGFIFPLRTRSRLVGVIELLTRASRQRDQPLFEAVADVGAKLGEFLERLDLESERNDLLRQLEQSHSRQDFLLRANRALVNASGFEDTVNKLAEVAVPMLGDICLIDVLESDGGLNRMAARHADPSLQPLTDELGTRAPDLEGDHPAAVAIRKGESQWSVNMSDSFMRATTQGDDHYRITRTLGFESYVSVPLLAESEPIGALTLVSAGSGRTIGSNELRLAEELASQVATVINRARQFDEQSMIARHLQRSLLPQSIDQNSDIRVAVRYVTGDGGAQVGGDFYDVIPISKRKVALVIGDVEGHDMTAATFMGQLRSALRSYLMLNSDPGVILSLLAEYALRSETQRLATAILCVLDSETGEFHLASAGHPPPLIIDGHHDPDPGPLSIETGLPLGVGRHTYVVTMDRAHAGARFVFYTDGLIDVGRPGAEERLARLTDLVEGHTRDRCEELADAIIADQIAPGSTDDDVALLVVEWTGSGSV
jgi:PAS domain S-box-containing protein